MAGPFVERRARRTARRALRLAPSLRASATRGPRRAPAQLHGDAAAPREPGDALDAPGRVRRAARVRAPPLHRARPALARRLARAPRERTAARGPGTSRERPRAGRSLADHAGRLAPHGHDAHGARPDELGRRRARPRALAREPD